VENSLTVPHTETHTTLANTLTLVYIKSDKAYERERSYYKKKRCCSCVLEKLLRSIFKAKAVPLHATKALKGKDV
jgi:hypothetical protein